GHSHAAGVTLSLDQLETFQQRFAEYALRKLTEEDLIRELALDSCITPAEITGTFVQELFRFAPFGQGNPLPVLMMEDVTIESCAPMGVDGRHLKLRLGKDGSQVFTKAWNLGEQIHEFSVGSRLHAAVTIEQD